MENIINLPIEKINKQDILLLTKSLSMYWFNFSSTGTNVETIKNLINMNGSIIINSNSLDKDMKCDETKTCNGNG